LEKLRGQGKRQESKALVRNNVQEKSAFPRADVRGRGDRKKKVNGGNQTKKGGGGGGVTTQGE